MTYLVASVGAGLVMAGVLHLGARRAIDVLMRHRSRAAVHHDDNIRQLEAACELAGLGAFEWCLRGDHGQWSGRAREIFGLDPETAVSAESMLSHIHPEDRSGIARTIGEVAARGGRFDVEHRVVWPDGAVRHVRLSGASVGCSARHGVAGIRGVVRDVSDERSMEERLRAAWEAERAANERLTAVDEMKNNILAAVSHELRTPLTSVIGFGLTLRDHTGIDGDRAGVMLDHLVREALRLEQMLQDLLDLDRLRRGLIEPVRRDCDLAVVVGDAIDGLPDDARARVARDLAHVWGGVDAAKVERIVQNLVLNACKHTTPGTRVWVRVAGDETAVCICVEDDGAGVPVELRERIFEPFERGDALGHSPGTGIGLSLVAQFTQMHGGRVEVDDRPGGGARFRVWLPLEGEGEVVAGSTCELAGRLVVAV